MDQSLRLANEGLRDLGIRVAQATHGNPAAKIKVALARDIPKITPRPTAEGNVEPPITGHDVLLIERLNLGAFVPNHRWGSLHDIFHKTTSVPTPASVKISNRRACGTRPSTSETFSMPASIAATALSTLGIIPLSTTPDRLRSATSLALR